MCYNKETSLQTFSVALFSSIFLFIRNYDNDRLLATFFIIVSLMQLAEYFMWVDQKCGKLNHYATKTAMVLILLQPLSFLLATYFYGNITISKYIILNIFLCMFLLSFIISCYILNYNKPLCSKPRFSNGHLNWDTESIFKTVPNIITNLFFILYFLIPFLLFFFKSRIEGFTYFILYMITLVYSLYLTRGYGVSWKSFWCYTVNYIPVLAIFIGWYFHKNK